MGHGLSVVTEPTRCLGERQIHTHRPVGKGLEAMMPIKIQGGVVLRIDNQRKYHRLRPQYPRDCVDEKCTAEPLPSQRLIDRQATDQAGRERIVARQAGAVLGCQLGQWQAGGSQRVVTGQLAGRIDRHESNC